MRKSLYALPFLLCAAPLGWAQQTESVIPAGTLLRCTLDEPNFSSRTAQVGDPVLCHVNSLEMFGRPLIPRGAYLSARLEDYKDPGHFFGKGWLQLEFTSLALPSGVYPLDAKVISAGRYRVDGEGKIHGHGHPARDAVEWTIPILWPVKVLTLPDRGPRPAIKGETHVELRLMEDVAIPAAPNPIVGELRPRPPIWQPGPQDPSSGYQNSQFRGSWSGSSGAPAPRPVAVPAQPSYANYVQPRPAPSRLTLLVLRGGRTYLVTDYWVDNGNLEYTTSAGAPQVLPLEDLDFPMTAQLNAERGVPFVLKSN